MAQQFGSFLIRVWRTGVARRFAIEHIQSGEKVVAASAAEAIDWVSARTGTENDLPGSESGQTSREANDGIDGRRIELEGR